MFAGVSIGGALDRRRGVKEDTMTRATQNAAIAKGPAMRPNRSIRRLVAGMVGTFLLAVGALAPPPAAIAAPQLRAALNAHLAAIEARDLGALLPTLTSGNDLTMIAPDGHKFDTRAQYIDFHRKWFASKDDGKLAFEIVRVIASPALAHALVSYRYTSRDMSGKSRTTVAWLTLTFALENGAWHLVFDQNTLIPASP
jgi:ketosteroid isomerase-like protein